MATCLFLSITTILFCPSINQENLTSGFWLNLIYVINQILDLFEGHFRHCEFGKSSKRWKVVGVRAYFTLNESLLRSAVADARENIRWQPERWRSYPCLVNSLPCRSHESASFRFERLSRQPSWPMILPLENARRQEKNTLFIGPGPCNADQIRDSRKDAKGPRVDKFFCLASFAPWRETLLSSVLA